MEEENNNMHNPEGRVPRHEDSKKERRRWLHSIPCFIFGAIGVVISLLGVAALLSLTKETPKEHMAALIGSALIVSGAVIVMLSFLLYCSTHKQHRVSSIETTKTSSFSSSSSPASSSSPEPQETSQPVFLAKAEDFESPFRPSAPFADQLLSHPPTPKQDAIGPSTVAEQPSTPKQDTFGPFTDAEHPSTPKQNTFGPFTDAEHPSTSKKETFGPFTDAERMLFFSYPQGTANTTAAEVPLDPESKPSLPPHTQPYIINATLNNPHITINVMHPNIPTKDSGVSN